MEANRKLRTNLVISQQNIGTATFPEPGNHLFSDGRKGCCATWLGGVHNISNLWGLGPFCCSCHSCSRGHWILYKSRMWHQISQKAPKIVLFQTLKARRELSEESFSAGESSVNITEDLSHRCSCSLSLEDKEEEKSPPKYEVIRY